MNKRGQSIIEYALIAVLVVFGVVVMGPYVLRSINAHFKLWDDGVKDSFEETLVQAPISDIPPISTTCTCSDTPGSCGGSIVGAQCQSNERIISHTCTPQLCDREASSYCKYDTSCCTASKAVGCGTVPIGQAAPTNNCNYSQRIFVTQCSTLPVQCNPDASCNPVCLGTPPSSGGLFCMTSSTTAPTSGLDQNYTIGYVANQSSCPQTPNCQVYCTSPYVLNSTGTGCVNPASSTTNCAFYCPNPTNNPFPGTWTGQYHPNNGNTGPDIYVTVTCSSSTHTLNGICINVNSGNRGTGGAPCPNSSDSNSNTVSCNWSGNEIFYDQSKSSAYTMTCNNGQLAGFGTGAQSQPVSGCNWSGAQDIVDQGNGNDMFLTCTNGSITQFQYGPSGTTYPSTCQP